MEVQWHDAERVSPSEGAGPWFERDGPLSEGVRGGSLAGSQEERPPSLVSST
jgi:hypothetical protein